MPVRGNLVAGLSAADSNCAVLGGKFDRRACGARPSAAAALSFWRWTFALLLLLPLAWPHLKRDWPVLSANWAIVALLGALAIGSFNILFYSGLQSTTALNSMLSPSAVPDRK